MCAKHAWLVDEQGQTLAVICVEIETDHFVSGKIIENHFTNEMKKLFTEFQAMVEGQVFSLLDEYDNRIENLRIKVVLPELNRPLKIHDLQIYDLSVVSFHIDN